VRPTIALSALRIHQIKASLDSIGPLFKSIQATVHAGQTFFNTRHARFKVSQVLNDTIDLLVDAPQINQNDVVALFGHCSPT
jgi:hypothetical protein